MSFRPISLLILADYITYAVERTRKHLHVRMPITHEVQQSYPANYKLGMSTVRRMEKEFNVQLPREEAAGIALNNANAQISFEDVHVNETTTDDRMLEDVTQIIKGAFYYYGRWRVVCDLALRYARAVYVQTLGSWENLETVDLNATVFAGVREQFPKDMDYANETARHISSAWGCGLSDDELLYTIIHIGGICS